MTYHTCLNIYDEVEEEEREMLTMILIRIPLHFITETIFNSLSVL